MQLNYLYDKKVTQENFCGGFDMECDVCVVGLGTAGAIAAIAAAKQGASVVGVEKMSIMGGSGTGGGVYDYFYGNRGGLYEKINEECFEMLKKGYLSTDRYRDRNSLPSTVKAAVLEKEAVESGCRLLYKTGVTGVFTEEKRVRGIRVFSEDGFLNIGARVVLDCTGEAFVCRMCGCEMMWGREFDNRLMRFSKPIGMIYDGYMVAIWNNYDFADLSSAQNYSKKALESMVYTVALRDEYSNDSRVMFESTHIGVRECACVKCEESLTFEEYAEQKQIKEPLLYAFAPMDNANHDVVFESDVHKDWFVFGEMNDYGFSVPISAGMMIPKGYDGLMIAAKGLGVGHDMSGLVRMKRDLEKCGEAAATVAAYAAKNNLSPRDVPYEAIIGRLTETGCYSEENNSGLHRLRAALTGEWIDMRLPNSNEEIKRILSSDFPATAVWRLRMTDRDEACGILREWLGSGDERLVKNSAFALGMLGDDSGAEIIRGILMRPAYNPEKIYAERFYPDLSRAIVAVGRLRDEKCVARLEEIMNSNGKGCADSLNCCEYYKTKEDFESNFVSLAVFSLLQIAETAEESLREEITAKTDKWMKTPNENEALEKIRLVFYEKLCKN